MPYSRCRHYTTLHITKISITQIVFKTIISKFTRKKLDVELPRYVNVLMCMIGNEAQNRLLINFTETSFHVDAVRPRTRFPRLAATLLIKEFAMYRS